MTLRETTIEFSKNLPGVDLDLLDNKYELGLEELIQFCADKTIWHPDWGYLAGKLSILQLREQKGHIKTMKDVAISCQNQLHERYFNFVTNDTNAVRLENMIIQDNNFKYDIFALETLRKSYLLKHKKKSYSTKENTTITVCEEPEQMFMRVATFLWLPNFEKIQRCYLSMTNKKYTHASPTLFNSGARRPALSSCFLLHVGDNMSAISKVWNDCAIISKNVGGIGIDLASIRHSEIGETGKSSGIIPLIKVIEPILNYVDQGGKRKGSGAMYLPAWHVDFMDFIEMKKKYGDEKMRAKDLFYACWISDLFMKRVQNDEIWSFFCPNKAKGLTECWGIEFENLYTKYEIEGKWERQLPAKEIMFEICKSQIETGVPYVNYKDSINRKSMQSNIGIIRSSNLCVAPYTKILTSTGYQTISTLKDKQVDVWNGSEWSPTIVRQTGEDAEMMSVTFDNHITLDCTPYHKFYIQGRKHPIECQDLIIGMKLIDWVGPDKNISTNVRVSKIEKLNEKMDTYCFTEEKRGMGIFNGVITGQCSEIVLHTSPEEIASCNLASLCLNTFVISKGRYDFEKLGNVVFELVENMNQVIDRNYYPDEIPQIKYANMKNRPIGIGVQGLADTFALMDYEWDSEEAIELDRQIFETIYYHAVKSSVNQAKTMQLKYDKAHFEEFDAINNLIAKTHDQKLIQELVMKREKLNKTGPKKSWYPSFPGSPYSKGKFQFDLWLDEYVEKHSTGEVNLETLKELKRNRFITPDRYNWYELKVEMKKYGLRNSTLIAVMPTASSAHINDNNECIEPFNALLGRRTVLSGQFTILNKHMVRDFEKLGIWDKKLASKIIQLGGSIQELEVPEGLSSIKKGRFNYLKKKYKTVYELKQKVLLDHSIARAPFICQTISQNCFMANPTIKDLFSYHMYGWKHGLKTGMYYLRSSPSHKAINVVVNEEKEECLACTA